MYMNKEFYKNIFTIFTGSSVSQIIWILTIPILTRIYSVSDFGIYQLFTSTASVMIIFATARYELAIVVPKKNEHAFYLTILSIIICTIVSLIIYCLIIFKNEYLYFFDFISIKEYILYLPIYLISLAFYQSLYLWFVRKSRFRVISLGLIFFSIINFIFAYIFNGIHYINNGLILATIIARYIEILYFTAYFVKDNIYLIKNIKIYKILAVAKEYKDFPQYMMVGGFFDTLSSALPSYFLNYFFGSQVTGFYSLANQCLNMPISLVSKSIGDVFKQTASNIYSKQKECITFFNENLKLLIKTSIVVSILILLFAPMLFKIFFGEIWEESGIYSRFLILVFVGGVIASPLSNIYIIARMQRLYLKIQFLILVVNSIALFIGGYIFENIHISLILLGFFNLLVSTISVYFGRKIAKGELNGKYSNIFSL